MRRGTAVAVAGLALLIPTVGAAETVSFSRDIVPVLRSDCASCHLTGEEPPGGLKLYPSAAYKSLVKVPSKESRLPRVSPGDPQASYLMHKLDGTHLTAGGEGVQMPFGLPPLAEETRNTIRRWIEQGAKNN